MKILALEFSSPMRSVAVSDGVRVLGRAAEQGGRETKAFALIEAALAQAGITREEIECVAVGIGPGSYAGIRIAISIAQGWQLATGVKLLGISSADCVAAQMHERGERGVLNVVVDAQRGELFGSRYELGDEWKELSDFTLFSDPTRGNETIVRPDLDERAAPDAATLAKIAARESNFIPPAEMEPIYLRKAEFVKAPPPRFS
jgi:tRNA threonylcarbamoyl adenosine modification protein YeaZ